MPIATSWDNAVGFSETVKPTASRAVQKKRDELWVHWMQHPWNFVSGRDETDRPLIWTTDEKDLVSPVKPFPAHLDYLKTLVCTYHQSLLAYDGGQAQVVLVDKCRQMLVSWTTLLFLIWLCASSQGRRCLLAKVTEEDAKEMLRDKVRAIHPRLPLWVRDRLVMSSKPEVRVDFAGGSYILAVAENVAQAEARGGTATVVFVDEAARQWQFKETLAASVPMTALVIAVTTADTGTPGATCFRDLLQEDA